LPVNKKHQAMEFSKNYYPPMHSAEHILNQTMVRLYNCGRSFTHHIEKKKSKCDYHYNRPLNDQEVIEIERKVNEIIGLNLSVTEEFMSKQEALIFFNLGKLPEESGDQVRIIRIGDYDACPCIGQHVNSTKEIGTFRIISHSFENEVLRLRFKV
jgi:misacylated tRNA(Ala) deacylase